MLRIKLFLSTIFFNIVYQLFVFVAAIFSCLGLHIKVLRNEPTSNTDMNSGFHELQSELTEAQLELKRLKLQLLSSQSELFDVRHELVSMKGSESLSRIPHEQGIQDYLSGGHIQLITLKAEVARLSSMNEALVMELEFIKSKSCENCPRLRSILLATQSELDECSKSMYEKSPQNDELASLLDM